MQTQDKMTVGKVFRMILESIYWLANASSRGSKSIYNLTDYAEEQTSVYVEEVRAERKKLERSNNRKPRAAK